jgi:hypothetical protein
VTYRSTTSTAESVYKEIVSRGSMRKVDIMRFAGMRGNCADVFLTSMEINGFLLSEDDKGVLYPFRRIYE